MISSEWFGIEFPGEIVKVQECLVMLKCCFVDLFEGLDVLTSFLVKV